MKPPKSRAAKEPAGRRLTHDAFRYPDQLGLTLPSLVLAMPVPDRAFQEEADYREPRFKAGRVWHKLAHQTGGNACHQHYLYATALTPKSVAVCQALSALTNQWYGSNAGVFGTTLDELVRYRAELVRLFGADCNVSYSDLEEGLYPLDVEHISKVAADVLPPDKDDLVEWKDGWQRAIGCINRWKLFALGTNSD